MQLHSILGTVWFVYSLYMYTCTYLCVWERQHSLKRGWQRAFHNKDRVAWSERWAWEGGVAASTTKKETELVLLQALFDIWQPPLVGSGGEHVITFTSQWQKQCDQKRKGVKDGERGEKKQSFTCTMHLLAQAGTTRGPDKGVTARPEQVDSSPSYTFKAWAPSLLEHRVFNEAYSEQHTFYQPI